MTMERYYYLMYSLFFLGLLALALFWRRDLFRFTYPAILFGIVAGPVSQLLYLTDYWRPMTLLGYGRISIEDSIFGAGIFGLAFVLYPFINRRGFHVPQIDSRVQHLRFGGIIVFGTAVFAIMSQLGLNTVITTSTVFILLWLVIGYYRRDLMLPGFISGCVLVILATVVYWFGFSIISTRFLTENWLLHNQPLGLTLGGKIPVTELIWFFGVGCFLSVFDLFTSGKHYTSMSQASGARPSSLARRSSTAGTPDNK